MSLEATAQNINNSKIDYTTLIFDDNNENNLSSHNLNSNSKSKKKLHPSKRSSSVKKNTFYLGQNYYPSHLFNSLTNKGSRDISLNQQLNKLGKTNTENLVNGNKDIKGPQTFQTHFKIPTIKTEDIKLKNLK